MHAGPHAAGDEDPLVAVARVHGGAGPWVVAGWRMGQHALRVLGVARGSGDLEVVHYTPRQVQYACIADGASASTGASVGKLNLTLADAPAAETRTTYWSKSTGRSITLRVAPSFVAAFKDVPREKLEAAAREVLAWPDERVFEVVPAAELSAAQGSATSRGAPVPGATLTQADLDAIAPRVIDAAGKNADVKAMCAASAARGGRCLLDVEETGAKTCPAGLAGLHPCLWSVRVSANMKTHTSRLATLFVAPDGTIVGASDLGCPPMRLADWAKVEAARRGGKAVDGCPAPLPDAPR